MKSKGLKMNTRNTLIVILAVLAALTMVAGCEGAEYDEAEVGQAQAALASNTLTGRFTGTVFMNGIDIDQDGSNGRSGTLRAHEGSFKNMDANVDVSVGPVEPGCDAPYTLIPSGEVVFSTNNGLNVIIVKMDADQFFCPDGSIELLDFTIHKGFGVHEGATGTGYLEMPNDTVIRVTPGPIPYPEVVFVYDAKYEIEKD